MAIHFQGPRGRVDLMRVKRPAVAGLFYPADATHLRREVDAYLDAVPVGEEPAPKAIIAPHAGYRYSGPVAASAYARLRARAGTVERVVLLGPNHRVPVRGVAASSADVFDTPIGQVAADGELRARALGFPQVRIYDEAFAEEHSLEVHLPFLIEALGTFRVLPLLVGEASPEQVSEVLGALWGGPETAIVVSSDLSHYHDYETARRLDAATSKSIEALRYEALGHESACGRNAVSGLLRLGRERGLEVRTVDLRNSGDTAGPRDQVVGYGAWVLVEAAAHGRLGDAERRRLLDIAAASIRHGLDRAQASSLDLAPLPAALREPGASFVTLKIGGELRGCIGSLTATRALAEDVAQNARSAAFADPRFARVSAAEAERLEISVSVLSAPEPLPCGSEAELLAKLRPGVDGLIIEEGSRRATFLPAVWESLPDPRDFLEHLRKKAGLPPGYWSPRMRVQRYTTESFS